MNIYDSLRSAHESLDDSTKKLVKYTKKAARKIETSQQLISELNQLDKRRKDGRFRYEQPELEVGEPDEPSRTSKAASATVSGAKKATSAGVSGAKKAGSAGLAGARKLTKKYQESDFGKQVQAKSSEFTRFMRKKLGLEKDDNTRNSGEDASSGGSSDEN